MRAYYEDLKALFRRAGDAKGPVVVQIEPDMWGYMQQRHGDDARRVPVSVASSGMGDVQDLPNTAPGFAKAVLRLRSRYAPRALVGYHLSIWGTNKDIVISNEPDRAVDALAPARPLLPLARRELRRRLRGVQRPRLRLRAEPRRQARRRGVVGP